MKRIIFCLLSASMFLGTINFQAPIHAEEINNSSNESSDLRLQEQEIYKTMVQEKADFDTDPLELIKDNTEYQIVSSCEDANYANTIVQSVDGAVYAMLEIDKATDTITVQLNGNKYTLNSEGENISLVSENGDAINVVETIYEDEPDAVNTSSIGNNQVATTAASSTWLYKSGPFHKSTRMNLAILDIINVAAGAYTCVVFNPVLGTIVFIYGLAVSAGETISPTIHIKYYQEHAFDCYTYIRETDYYYGAYSESSGTFYEPITTTSGSIKYSYTYFHSVRPDYTGNSACLAYPQ